MTVQYDIIPMKIVHVSLCKVRSYEKSHGLSKRGVIRGFCGFSDKFIKSLIKSLHDFFRVLFWTKLIQPSRPSSMEVLLIYIFEDILI